LIGNADLSATLLHSAVSQGRVDMSIPPTQGDILVVDDTPTSAQLLSQILVQQGHRVRAALSGPEALAAAQAAPPDLILLDIMMPGMNGYEVCQQLKADERTHDIPVVFISALGEAEDKLKAFTVGGVDYIPKPFQPKEVVARVATHMALRRAQESLQVQNIELQQAKAQAEERSLAAEASNVALAALSAVGMAVNTSLDLEASLEQAIGIVLHEMQLDYGWLFLSEDDGRLLRLAATVGLPDEFREREALTSADRCACGETAATGQVGRYFGEDTCARLTTYCQKHPDLSAKHISLPVTARQKTIGVLNLGGGHVVDLTSSQYEWLAAVVQQIGHAVEKAALYQNVSSKAERLTVLNRISTIVSLSWKLDQVLPLLLREMARVLETSLGVIVLRSGGDKGSYKVRTWFGRWRSSIKLDTLVWDELPLLNTIRQTGVPLLIPRAAGDERLEPLAALIEQEAIQTVLTLPLIVQAHLTGFIQLYTLGQPRLFEVAEIELARTLTNQAAVAIEKARLYEATVARYEQELEIARRIQQNLLPHIVPEVAGLRLAGVCQPAYEVGGDFYDYVPLPDHRLGVVVGDVTGKSLPAAMVMALARNTIRSELVNQAGPAAAMTVASRWLYQDMQRGTFVAAVQALIAPVDHVLWLVNAGQTAPLLLREGQVDFLWPAEAGGLPLGAQPDTTYGQAQVQLQSGDVLLFYSDGIVEGVNTAGEMFGFERLESALRRLSPGRTPAQILEDLLAEMKAFVGKADQRDDITLVVVEIE
jgi:serine phosphatase RsbU (regulator of sigma subunit)/CheY-like chemotaxis protein